jgi:hypothetical protein
MTLQLCLNIAGLVLTFGGAIISASGVMLTEKTASTLAGTYWDENPHLKAALLKQSRRTALGLLLVAAGSALQLTAMLV